ncbi:hypothetical protein AC00_3992 [Escherichia coli 1-250-04_S3_C1]|uniref:Uncharacterized protein n=1 Tax=Escherichia coli 1-250-04_S3_C1 TaxID=1444135 RepID=A0AAN4NQH3_ECOLX|nr:hypothetical protein AC00_3992 [Escherichia coli 1-250-04_S3_C1]
MDFIKKMKTGKIISPLTGDVPMKMTCLTADPIVFTRNPV